MYCPLAKHQEHKKESLKSNTDLKTTRHPVVPASKVLSGQIAVGIHGWLYGAFAEHAWGPVANLRNVLALLLFLLFVTVVQLPIPSVEAVRRWNSFSNLPWPLSLGSCED